MTTAAPGTDVQVVNSGTNSAAVFDFTIPRGQDGTGAGDMTKAVYDPAGKAAQIATQAELEALPYIYVLQNDTPDNSIGKDGDVCIVI